MKGFVRQVLCFKNLHAIDRMLLQQMQEMHILRTSCYRFDSNMFRKRPKIAAVTNYGTKGVHWTVLSHLHTIFWHNMRRIRVSSHLGQSFLKAACTSACDNFYTRKMEEDASQHPTTASKGYWILSLPHQRFLERRWQKLNLPFPSDGCVKMAFRCPWFAWNHSKISTRKTLQYIWTQKNTSAKREMETYDQPNLKQPPRGHHLKIILPSRKPSRQFLASVTLALLLALGVGKLCWSVWSL